MYRRDTKGWLKHFDFMVLDLVILQVSFVLSYMLRHGIANPYALPVYSGMGAFLLLGDLIIIFFTEPFRNILKRGYYREFESLVQQTILVELCAVFFLFSQQAGEAYSRISMITMGVIYLVLSYFVRLGWKQVLKKRQKIGSKSLLLVTTREDAEQTVEQIHSNNYGAYRICGIVLADGTGKTEEISGIPVVATAEAAELTRKTWVDEVFVNVADQGAFPRQLIENFVEMGITVHLNLLNISAGNGRRQLVERLAGYSVLTTTMNYATTRQAFMKRAMDIAGGLVGCCVCALLFVFVAPAIYIKSPGPVFFAQERIGKNGKRFKMYKFRSMYLDAEERKKELMAQNKLDSDLMFKMDFDPRIIGNKILPDGTHKTGIGQFIRSTSIDEFPQFFNVLKGDMSLVGTRPPTVDEWEKYQLHHRARLAIKPGITGMWQVSGRSDITDFEEVVRLDTQYINEWSLGLDIKLLFKTVGAVLGKDGSM